MADETRTETRWERKHPGGPPPSGLIIVYQRGKSRLLPYSVDAPKTFGRGREADVVLDDPGASRLHVRFEPAPGGLLLTDLESRNGTFADGAAISEARTFAAFGAVIRVAKTLFFAVEDVARFAVPSPYEDSLLVGGPSLNELFSRIRISATTSAPVLLQGETGTGKELVARAIHDASERQGELVALNCGALPAELMESELFGHARGAFSGSSSARAGLFRAADRGTLLLDEIGELPLPAQTKLLRVLETGEVRSVGDDRPAKVDVRLVAATHRDLRSMVHAGSFREDLLHRVAAVQIRVPPLRERLEDVPRLCDHFLSDQGVAVSVQAMEVLLGRKWSGNVRELKNVVATSALVAREAKRDQIAVDDLAAAGADPVSDEDGSDRSRLVAALARTGGSVTEAARELGIARSGLYETLRRLKLDPASFRRPRG
jgi:two-component system, NtrC family, response regulator GlrR